MEPSCPPNPYQMHPPPEGCCTTDGEPTALPGGARCPASAAVSGGHPLCPWPPQAVAGATSRACSIGCTDTVGTRSGSQPLSRSLDRFSFMSGFGSQVHLSILVI